MVGRVLKVEPSVYKVKTEEGKILRCVAKGNMRFLKLKPLVGDIVGLNADWAIDKIYPRDNEFIRPPIANINQIIMVMATTNPKPDLMLHDKQLVMAEKIGLDILICINKIDLKDDCDDIIDTYEKIGYQVITTDAKNGLGVEKLAVLLKGKITAFTGNSGVGKSALTNNIFRDVISEEGLVSDKTLKGKHTTKYVELFEIAPDTYIADTPGFSSYDVQGISCKDLDKYFIEFLPHISECEFRGCTHIKEKKCGVKNAVEKMKIDKGRYERYCTLYQKLKEDKKW